MRLCDVQVLNFKCIKDSTQFRLDQITCLVGKNEAGKTALLEAMQKINPLDQADALFTELDYPRQYWNEYKSHRQKDPADAICSWWELDEAELAAIGKLILS